MSYTVKFVDSKTNYQSSQTLKKRKRIKKARRNNLNKHSKENDNGSNAQHKRGNPKHSNKLFKAQNKTRQLKRKRKTQIRGF